MKDECLYEECTCCGDVELLYEGDSDEFNGRKFALYRTKMIDLERNREDGWIYFILEKDDEFPVVLTEKAAKELLENPKKGYSLALNRYFDRYR